MECEKFIKKNLQERKEFVSTNKLCWNCLSKAHFVKQCKSKYRCKIDKCGKHHHSLLHEPEPPDKKHPQENKGQTLPVLVNSHHKGNCYLQVIPLILTNGSFKVKTNALLDSGSDSTLVSQDTADKLRLNGENRQLQISNVFNTQISHLSKLVEFNISSDMHPNPIKVSHSWVVPNLDLPKSKILQNIHDWPHLRDIKIPTNNYNVTVLIGTDMPQRHLQEDTRIGETNDPIAVKTTLGWVLMGRKNSVNKINANRLVTDENINLDQQLEKFWTIESYGTHSIESSKIMFNKEERRALDILGKTTVKNGNCYEVGLLWKNEETKLPYNGYLTVNRFKSTENKFNRNPEIATKYRETVNSYIESGYTRKLSKEEADSTSNITNYIPHHSVVNPNKPGK